MGRICSHVSTGVRSGQVQSVKGILEKELLKVSFGVQRSYIVLYVERNGGKFSGFWQQKAVAVLGLLSLLRPCLKCVESMRMCISCNSLG